MNVELIKYTKWDGATETISGSQITLTGSPVFVRIFLENVTSNENFSRPALQASPNPVHGVLCVSGITVGETVWVHTITGTLVFHSEVKETTMEINFAEFEKGVYIVRVGDRSVKIMKR